MDLAILDIEDPTDWPNTLPDWRQLDNHLRCPICKEYFATPMTIVSCSHNFCSLCIRRHLSVEKGCPTCRTPVEDVTSELRPNRLVDNIVSSFKSGRKSLLDIINKEDTAMKTSTPKKSNKTQNTGHSKRLRSQMKKRNYSADKDSGIGAPNSEVTTILSSSSSHDDYFDSDHKYSSGSDYEDIPKKRLKKSKPTNNSRSSQNNLADKCVDSSTPIHQSSSQGEDGKVACPNCQKQIFSSIINSHLDRCLQDIPKTKQNPKKQASSVFNWGLKRQANNNKGITLPKPTKLVYSIMSEAKLRRTLKDLGIPHHGDKYTLQARHTEWVALYLANDDSTSPRSHKKLLMDLEKWEQAMLLGSDVGHSNSSNKRNTSSSASGVNSGSSIATASGSFSSLSTLPATTTPTPITDANDSSNILKEHNEKYASSYEELIALARKSRPPANPATIKPPQSSKTDINDSNNPSIVFITNAQKSPTSETMKVAETPPAIVEDSFNDIGEYLDGLDTNIPPSPD